MPTVLSFVGVGTAGLSTVAAHRVPFLVVSALLLACSGYVNMRQDTWWFNKLVTLLASLTAFSLSARW